MVIKPICMIYLFLLFCDCFLKEKISFNFNCLIISIFQTLKNMAEYNLADTKTIRLKYLQEKKHFKLHNQVEFWDTNNLPFHYVGKLTIKV